MSQYRPICTTIGEYTPPTIRSYLRYALLEGVSRYNAVAVDQQRLLATPRVQFLCMHSVFSDEERGFARLVETLAKTHTFVSYSEAVHRVRSGVIDRPYLSFSFDDGMKNNAVAARILKQFGVKACFFVITDIVNEKDYNALAEFCRGRLGGPAVDFLSWKEIEELKSMGHEIGSHTASHRRLSDLSRKQIIAELEYSRTRIAEFVGPPEHFAWPYGRATDAPTTIVEIAAEAGYTSCASGARGCHISKSVDTAAAIYIRRDHIMCNWPERHIKYFLSTNVAIASSSSTLWP